MLFCIYCVYKYETGCPINLKGRFTIFEALWVNPPKWEYFFVYIFRSHSLDSVSETLIDTLEICQTQSAEAK